MRGQYLGKGSHLATRLNGSGSECDLAHLFYHVLSLAPHLNNSPDETVLESVDAIVIMAHVLDADVTVCQVIQDVLLVLIIEGTGLAVVDETRDTSGTAVVGYVPDLVDVIEACSQRGVHGHDDVLRNVYMKGVVPRLMPGIAPGSGL